MNNEPPALYRTSSCVLSEIDFSISKSLRLQISCVRERKVVDGEEKVEENATQLMTLTNLCLGSKN